MGELIIAGKLTRMVKATLEDTWSYVRVPTFVSGPLDVMNGLRKQLLELVSFSIQFHRRWLKIHTHTQASGLIFTKSIQLIGHAADVAFTARTSGRILLSGRCSWVDWSQNKSDWHSVYENEYKKSFGVINHENWDSDNIL